MTRGKTTHRFIGVGFFNRLVQFLLEKEELVFVVATLLTQYLLTSCCKQLGRGEGVAFYQKAKCGKKSE